ncbi:alpha/beta fold hydrolase [Saccharomonospora iraqiensis]|uniref:alpha/beta fold hydrolase n=1 Tax=Saccharomonospora iraqiensis TaxID=52698 RepID=UPI000422EBEE|nr:alpha/beta hydrolase [Saccharomonospora iraqiensis]
MNGPYPAPGTESRVVDFGGHGPPIVLLHALMGRARTWRSVARWLRPYGHVVGLDARGHGYARNLPVGRTEDFAADVAGLVTQLGEGPAVLVGHSMGGLHALVTAATRPELVRAVVVEDMAPDLRELSVETWRGHFDSWPVPFRSPEHVREFFGRAGDYFVECVERRDDGYHLIADPDDLYAVAEEWTRRDFRPYVDAVRCPVLVIEAGDSAMPPGQQAELAARVPGGRHVVVPDAAHVVHDDAPDEYRGAVEAFLSGLGPGEVDAGQSDRLL